VKAKLAKAFAQLRHAVHHYTEVKRDVEQGLLDRENKLAERHQGDIGGTCSDTARQPLLLLLLLLPSTTTDMYGTVDAKLRSLEASLAESRCFAAYTRKVPCLH
jgi:hypothetical protein